MAFTENQIIVIWAFITAYLVKLITCFGEIYQYDGYLCAESMGNCVKAVLGLFFIPYIVITMPLIAVIIIPILIMLGLWVRFIVEPKNGVSIRLKFFILTLLLWAWSGINQFALEAIASA